MSLRIDNLLYVLDSLFCGDYKLRTSIWAHKTWLSYELSSVLISLTVLSPTLSKTRCGL